MGAFKAECLRCGQPRWLQLGSDGRTEAGECSRCGYVGWAPSIELTELERRRLRELPVEERRPHAA